MSLLLSGCSIENINPFTFFLENFSEFFNNNYGISIIFITFLVRLLLFPLITKQQKMTYQMQRNMKEIKPEIDMLKKKYSSPEKKEQLYKEIQTVYQKNNTSILNSMFGCLPSLIQIPVFLLLYYSIKNNIHITNSYFIDIPLGQSSIILAVITFLFYLIQAYIQIHSNSEMQMKGILYIMPVFMFVIALSLPSAISLYWSASGLFLIFQTLYLKKMKRKDFEQL